MFDKSLAKGILRYEDTYILANRYISKFNNLGNYFSKRFKYVFIDEMQDTKKEQEDILEKAFNKKETLIQRFGDVNQNIGLSSNEESGWVLYKKVMPINSSKRYGETMVKFLQPLRILKNGHMIGTENVETLNPCIIIFNDNNIGQVINKFIQIIKYYKINEKEGKIKVIGKIGINVKSPNLSIKSYTDKYIRNDKKDFLNKKVYYQLRMCKDLNSFYDRLISIIILSLKSDKGNQVSKEEFKRYMEVEKNYDFICYKSNIKKWFCNINLDNNKILNDIVDITSNLLSNLEKYVFDKSILEESILINLKKDVIGKKIKTEKHEEDANIINDINTVFGVKGETHLATLYLESKYISNDGKNLRSDIMKILDYMLNQKQQVEDEDKEALTAAYIAMSRAKILTCIAISHNTIKGRIKEFREYGYSIIGCDNEMDKLISEEIAEEK